MIIEVVAGIVSDGFTIRIMDHDQTVFHNSYRYDYNASHDKKQATTKEPYVTDILKKFQNTYHVISDDIEVKKGYNPFAEKQISDEAVAMFAAKYVSTLPCGIVA